MTTSEHKMVFVIGMHRSGTSMLGQMLARHSEISGLTGTGVNMDEGSLVQSAIPLPRGLGSLAFKRNARFDETSPLARAETAEAVMTAWRPYFDLTKPVLVEKSPNHIMSTRLLQALFPDARFICIVRHPIAQALAISKWATNRSIAQFLVNWGLCHDRLARDLPFLRHKVVFRYEDFCDAPQAMMDMLFDFIGVAPESVLDRPISSSNERYFQKWATGDGQGLSFVAQRAAARAFGARAFRKYGYQFRPPYVTEPRLRHLVTTAKQETA